MIDRLFILGGFVFALLVGYTALRVIERFNDGKGDVRP